LELSERKKKILAAVVELYVSTGEPVGSKALCDNLDFAVSSATVRNEMSDLAEMGLLDQPHTSAGRVPTQMGYRVYIDTLMKRKPVTREEKRFLDSQLLSSAYPGKLLDGVPEFWQPLRGLPQCQLRRAGVAPISARFSSYRRVAGQRWLF